MANQTTAGGGSGDERRTTAWIGSSLRVEGKITSRESLTIDGEVDGTIDVGGQSLLVGAGASVKADLSGESIIISGAVIGNVNATDKVDVRPTGSVHGDIVALRLILSEGAVVAGRIEAGRSKTAARETP